MSAVTLVRPPEARRRTTLPDENIPAVGVRVGARTCSSHSVRALSLICCPELRKGSKEAKGPKDKQAYETLK